MNEIQQQAVNDTMDACFPTSSQEFRDNASKLLSKLVDERNEGFKIQTERMSLVNRSMWNTYNLILAGPK